jgi:hypothetical protein
MAVGARPEDATTAAVSIVTTVTIGGSMVAMFLAVALWLGGMGFAVPGTPAGRPWTAWFIALGLTTVLAPPFVGGAVWGAALARMVGAPVRSAARTAALAFGGMVLLAAAPADATQLLLDDLPSWMPLGVHGYFTIVFMVTVGVVAAVATWRLARRLGVGDRPAAVGVRTGAGAALGFMLGSALALALGFRVLPWRHLSMVWATVTALPVSTLVAGAVLGRELQGALRAGTWRIAGAGLTRS